MSVKQDGFLFQLNQPLKEQNPSIKGNQVKDLALNTRCYLKDFGVTFVLLAHEKQHLIREMLGQTCIGHI